MKTNGVTINGIHSSEYGLLMSDLDIPSPTVKKRIIPLPGTDGALDLTTALNGRVNYENRKITLSFKFADGDPFKWQNVYSKLLNLYHGKEVELMFDFDDKYFWKGRLELSSTKKFTSYSTFTMTLEADPFKWSIYSSAENYLWDDFNFETDNTNDLSEVVIDGTTDVLVLGSVVAINPIIISDSQMTVEYEGMKYPVPQGEKKYFAITLKDGENILRFNGDGIIKISVRGGSL